MFKSKIEHELRKAVIELGFVAPTDIFISISEKSQFGDYSSNIALQLSKQKHQNRYQNPREIANAIIEELDHPAFLERVEAAGPGFLNFFIKDEELIKLLTSPEDRDALLDQEDLKTIIVEYCEPNTHKMLHIGHLLSLVLGEAMARFYEYQGHEVIRTNYGSDIGLTVAKCLWAIQNGKRDKQSLWLGRKYQEVREGSLRDKAQFLGEAYTYGHGEYEKSLDIKEEIDQITNKLYNNPYRSRSEDSLALAQGTLPSADAEGQRDPDLEIFKLWKETTDWSLGYFELMYSVFGTLFDRRINESEVDIEGKNIVLANVGKIFEKDQGAIIFPGEKYNLHNRVFINSKGNPTYEGKDIGLQEKYQELYQYDQVNIFSHKEQDDYFKVIIAANEMVFPHLKGKIKHISYGEVKLSTGKMSSRTGNVIAAEDIYNQVKEKLKTISPQLDELTIQKLAVAAIKFSFLKYSTASDIIYDLEDSVSLHGDTGPYVLYVYARITSLLKKSIESRVESLEDRATVIEAEEGYDDAQESSIAQSGRTRKNSENRSSEDQNLRKSGDSGKAGSLRRFEFPGDLEPEEREILRQLEYFEAVTAKATDNFQPNELVKYLLTLTKAFNGFYEKHHIVASNSEAFRVVLSKKVAETIKLGLYLLGIETVDKM